MTKMSGLTVASAALVLLLTGCGPDSVTSHLQNPLDFSSQPSAPKGVDVAYEEFSKRVEAKDKTLHVTPTKKDGNWVYTDLDFVSSFGGHYECTYTVVADKSGTVFGLTTAKGLFNGAMTAIGAASGNSCEDARPDNPQPPVPPANAAKKD